MLPAALQSVPSGHAMQVASWSSYVFFGHATRTACRTNVPPLIVASRSQTPMLAGYCTVVKRPDPHAAHCHLSSRPREAHLEVLDADVGRLLYGG